MFAAIAAGIVVRQCFVPPIIGMADQADFRRMIGRFGYRAETPGLETVYVAPKYIRGADTRVRDWEQFSSEYLFVSATVGLNKIISRDGKLDIRIMGFVHATALVAALVWLLYAARGAPILILIAIVLILTDVAYVAYMNTFFAEAS